MYNYLKMNKSRKLISEVYVKALNSELFYRVESLHFSLNKIARLS